MSVPYDIGAFIAARAVLSNTAGTTAGTAAASAVVDQRALTKRYHSVKALAPFSYTKTSPGAISVAVTMQHSHTTVSTDFVTLGTAGTAVTVAAGAGTGASSRNVAVCDVSLHNARRYLRMSVTRQISVVSTVSFMAVQGVMLFGGAGNHPA